MGIGIYELTLLMLLFVVPGIVIAVAIWFVARRNRGSVSSGSRRPTADRLVELESLRRAGHISTGEYEKQRASIISGI
jgi:hypothetical protein